MAVAPKPPARPIDAPRRPLPGIALTAVALLAVGGVGFFWYRQEGRPKADAAAAGETSHEHGDPGEGASGRGLPVDVAHPRAGGMERSTTQAASVHAFEHAELYAKVSGYLKVQNVDIGDRVKLGQLLAVIDDPEVDKAVEQAQAALDQANARVGVAQEKIASAEADKDATAAMVQQEEAEVVAKVSNQALQIKQLKRIEGLVARNAVEARLQDEQQDRYEVAVADVGVARASVLTARAQVLAKAALVSKARADLAEAKADVGIAQADLDRARVIQDYTRITSPYDGGRHPPDLPPGGLHPLGLRRGRQPPARRGPDRYGPRRRAGPRHRRPPPRPWGRRDVRGRRPPGPDLPRRRLALTPRPRTRRAGTCGPRSTCPTLTTPSARGCTGG